MRGAGERLLLVVMIVAVLVAVAWLKGWVTQAVAMVGKGGLS